MLQPGETQALSFDAPAEPGIYPYVCTYPGHWRRMYGALYVVADLKTYLANPEQYLVDHPLVLKDELLKYNLRDTDWKFTELADLVDPLPQGRSFEVGRTVFRAANCVACHRLNDEGQVFGPDLTKLDTKKQNPQYLLQSLLEPSKDIEEKYQSHAFVLDSGRVVSGMVLEETDDQVRIIVDPIAATEPLTVLKSQIDERRRLPNSIMPEGLLNRLSREEILDLIAYVYAQGDEKHELFHEHHH